MRVDLNEIQSGWDVYEPSGKRVGDVVGVESGTVHVQTGGLFAKDLYVPPEAIAEVEEHRVELAVPQEELKRQGMDAPPA